MSTISCTIRNIAVQVKNLSFSLVKTHGQRSILQLTLEDATSALAFYRGDEVVFTDSVKGDIYIGFVQSVTPNHLAVDTTNPYQEIAVTTMDNQYLVEKRANDKNYENWYSGDIAADFVESTLADEGVTGAYSLRHLTTVDDFNTGINSNTIGVTKIIGNDGQLQLAPSGQDFSFHSEDLHAPSTQNVIKMTSTMFYSGPISASTTVKIWQGSFVASAQPHLNWDCFIDPSSPQIKASIDIIASDGTALSAVFGSSANDFTDNQGLFPQATVDLQGLANVGWYSRTVGFGSLSGKTITSVNIVIGGQTAGDYTAYFRNMNFTNPSTIPVYNGESEVASGPTQLQDYGYQNTLVTVVSAYDLYSATGPLYFPNEQYNYPSMSISSVKLVRSSLVSWIAEEPTKNTNLVLKYSIDGGNSYYSLVNNAAIPYLPAGYDVSGLSLNVRVEYYNLSGQNVEQGPKLASLDISILSSFNATKTDITVPFSTATLWNTGTLTNVSTDANGFLLNSGTLKNWLQPNKDTTLFTTIASGGNPFFESLNRIGTFINLTEPGEMRVRFDAVPQLADFIAEVDCKIELAANAYGLVYRTTGWNNNNNTYAYAATLSQTQVLLGRGTNSSSGSGAFTSVASVATTISLGSWHRLKVIATGSNHQVFLDDQRVINATDGTYTAAGFFGLQVFDPNTSANLVGAQFNYFGAVTGSLVGTWVSPSTSLTSAGTYYDSMISWRDAGINYNAQTNTIILVEASIDGGTTYAICTNGSAIPGITQGQSLSGKSLVLRVTLTTATAGSLCVIDDLVVKIIGSAGTITGTRTTLPTVSDTMVGSNSVGSWPTTTDGQSYVKVGTGTVGRTSNENTIGVTTGDCWEVVGTRQLGDQEATVRFSLSNSSTVGGIQLRYVDANTFYRLSISTTAVSLIKVQGGTTTTLATTSLATATGTFYQLRFRVTGTDGGPVSLGGKIWLDGTVEPGTINGLVSRTDPQWTVSIDD